ncbi:MAG: hypothetical protein LC135_09480 [Phycisphaerae bacterium]|nr:hypothetical protein [Phycisphaerae bacterium]MCZ2400081.1 hypothetical protein [Phycisphaerae bacterium]
MPVIIGAASATYLILHASHLGPFSDNALRLTVIAMSVAAGAECAFGDRRTGLAISALTFLLYWLFLYPLELVPHRPVFFRAFYIATCAGSFALAPVMLLRRRFGLAAACLFAGAGLLAYFLP